MNSTFKHIVPGGLRNNISITKKYGLTLNLLRLEQKRKFHNLRDSNFNGIVTDAIQQDSAGMEKLYGLRNQYLNLLII